MSYKELFKMYFEMGHSRREAQRMANLQLRDREKINRMTQRELVKHCINKPLCM